MRPPIQAGMRLFLDLDLRTMTSILCIRINSRLRPEKVKTSPGFNLATNHSSTVPKYPPF